MDNQSFPGNGSPTDAIDDTSRMMFAIRAIVNKLATASLVQVKAIRGDVVDVQPLVHQVDGSRNAVPHGVIHNMPVWRLQGGISSVIVTPAVNDIGLAVFASSDISSAKRNKGPATPGSLRKFDWSDGIYLGGLLNAEPTQFIRMLAGGGIDITATGPITVTSSGSIQLKSGLVNTSETFAAGNGATGTFTSQDGKTVTVSTGIISRITP